MKLQSKLQLLIGIVIAVLLLGCTIPEASPSAQSAAFPPHPVQDSERAAPKATGIIHQVMVQGYEDEGVLSGARLLPPDVSLALGDTVLWVNKGKIRQTITFDDGSFQEILPPGGSVSRTFFQAGEFAYGSEFNADRTDAEDRLLRGMISVR